MKSIQIILLLCIHSGEEFPPTIKQPVIADNLDRLVKKGLIIKEYGNVLAGYEVTKLGKGAIDELWECI